MAKKNRIQKVTDEQIAAMAALGVSAETTTDEVVASRAGSDEKVAAVAAENAPPKVKTYTSEGRAWIESNKELNTEGLYGPHAQLALHPADLQLHAQSRGLPNDVAELGIIHGKDETAPTTTVNCTVCTKPITSFIRTAMIDRKTNGDLMRDKDGNVIYRGQFVVTGRPLAVHAAHTGDCLYQLRDNLKRKKELDNGKKVAHLLASQSFEQANARLAGIQGDIAEKVNENQAFKQRLGATVGDAVRHNGGRNRTDDGFDRGTFAPKTPRGQSRKQRRWTEEDVTE